MTPEQQQAFADAAGFHAAGISFDIKLAVGGLTVIGAVLILAGLMHLLNSTAPWDKLMFLFSTISLSFIVMLIFTYIA